MVTPPLDEKTKEKLMELRMVEQSLQAILMQKQHIQAQIAETENALKELEKNPPKVYKMVGNIMIEANIEDLKKELQNRKEVLELRLKSLDRQEERLRERLLKLQQEIQSLFKGGGVA